MSSKGGFNEKRVCKQEEGHNNWVTFRVPMEIQKQNKKTSATNKQETTG